MKDFLNNTNWKSVVLFYLFACLWSWPFFWWRDLHPESWKALQLPNFIKTWFIMWGPGISAILCFFIFKNHKRKITFRGNNIWFGISFYAVLPLALAIMNRSFEYLFLGIIGFISTLGEELGWRGFLQDALKINSDIKKSFVIGIMWELWHFTNRTAHSEFQAAIIRVSIWILILTIVSYLMMKLTNRSRSIFVAVAIHTAFNASFEFKFGWQAVLLCVPVWAFLIWKWPSKDFNNSNQ